MPPARAPVGGGGDAGKRTDLLVASQWTAARLVLHRKAEGVLEDRARRARRDDGEERDDVDVLLDEFFHRGLRVVVRDDGEVAVVRVRVDRRLAVVDGVRFSRGFNSKNI